MSQLTTHILDTTKGKPATGVKIILFQQDSTDPITTGWRQVVLGTTDDDGRVPNLLSDDAILEPAMYKLRFETKEYFEKQGVQTFYPFVEISFIIMDGEHYHVPLLLNPFGYSTYRGS